MLLQDIFVGCVAASIGLFILLAAIFNWDWTYQFWLAHWVESRCGRRGARWFYVILGGVLIALGIAIAAGYSPNKSRREAKRDTPAPRVLIIRS